MIPVDHRAMGNIPFNRPWVAGSELSYIQEAIANRHLSGGGPFTRRCQEWLERRVGCRQAFLTTSGTAALEMAAMLLDIRPGDEIIMPSYTFVSTATAFVLRGGVPVFVDIRPDTLNIDETRIEAAITARTRAIVAVHYAGVACQMDVIMDIARRAGLVVVEDAAQGLLACYHDRPLGSFGQLAAVSFHETKNVMCGEGGVLLVNDAALAPRAQVMWEKGTNRRAFLEGQIDKYTWVDLGSSYAPSEISAAFLWAQIEHAHVATAGRLRVWNAYHERFADLEKAGAIRRPIVPTGCRHNAHLYYLLVATPEVRSTVLRRLNTAGVNAVFHYVPLHTAPGGRAFARCHGDLDRTEDLAARLIRLPLWVGLTEESIEGVVDLVSRAIQESRRSSPHAPA
jgi:dTDP-4-amino-4,6-dideoxygalactose transaminase